MKSMNYNILAIVQMAVVFLSLLGPRDRVEGSNSGRIVYRQSSGSSSGSSPAKSGQPSTSLDQAGKAPMLSPRGSGEIKFQNSGSNSPTLDQARKVTMETASGSGVKKLQKSGSNRTSEVPIEIEEDKTQGNIERSASGKILGRSRSSLPGSTGNNVTEFKSESNRLPNLTKLQKFMILGGSITLIVLCFVVLYFLTKH